MHEMLKRALARAIEELHERKATLDAANERIQEAGEDADLEELRTAFDEAADRFDEAAEEVERCKRNLADAERRQRLIDENPVAGDGERAGSVRVTVEPPVYSPAAGSPSFFSDAWRHRAQADPDALERLHRHGRQVTAELRAQGLQYRDVGAGAFAGLTIPQFLIDLYAPLARAGSPTVNVLRKAPLPEKGMVLSISRGTTGTAVAAQATENTAVQETNFDDTKLDVDVRTYAGQQDVSRQALERSELVDEILFGDLVADYFAKLDNGVLNEDATGGTHLSFRSTAGIIAKAYTDASPTVAEFYSAVADALQQINKQRFAPATTIIMAPRRWGWLTAAGDTAGRPLVLAKDAPTQNPLAIGDAAAYGAYVGTLHGLPVITDANLPENLGAGTNEDVVLIIRTPDHLLWWEGDGMPRQLRFEETQGGNLSVKLVVYGYSAFTAGRYPKGVATVGGTGLVTPTFA